MNCKHELSYLMGTKDGIVCRKCGALFSSFDEIYPKEQAEPVEQERPVEKPKRGRSKKKDD